jgi:hypothetical protein
VLVTPILVTYRWWSATPLVNEVDFYLNFCLDFCVGITNVKIYVVYFLHLHLCLLGCTCYLSICWSNCHLISKGRGLSKCLPFNYDLGVGTCFQVDLLVVYDYYSM